MSERVMIFVAGVLTGSTMLTVLATILYRLIQRASRRP